MARKKKIRIDRVIVAGVLAAVVLFGTFKLIQFASDKVMAFFEGSETVETADTKDTRPVIILDPGHGADDGGAKKGELLEKDITLKIAKAAGEYLEKQNIKAVYTRTTDIRLDEDRRNDLKLRAEMSAKNKARYFVSIHVNDFKDSSHPTGFEIYQKKNEDDSINKESEALAKSIGSQIEALKYSKNRGIQSGSDLRVLKLNTVPSVLIETGYINNASDFKYLSDDSKLIVLGETIAKGIINQMQTK